MKYIVSLSGTKLDSDDRKLLKSPKVGGVILYLKNTLFNKSEDLKAYIREIRKAAGQEIKIYIDEEGGLVSRLLRFSENWSPAYLANLLETEGRGGEERVRDYLSKKAQFIKDLDIDVNLAPVVDYYPAVRDDILARSLGCGNADLVIRAGKIWIEEFQKSGVESCLKHFPGLGRSPIDSHEDLPVIDMDEKSWAEVEGRIFIELIEAGAENIMVGHAVFPQIQEDEVTSMSEFWIDKLRDLASKREFNVICDDICMGALDKIDVTEESLEKAGLDYVIAKDRDNLLIKKLLQD